MQDIENTILEEEKEGESKINLSDSKEVAFVTLGQCIKEKRDN
jgi:hypothetical protein